MNQLMETSVMIDRRTVLRPAVMYGSKAVVLSNGKETINGCSDGGGA